MFLIFIRGTYKEVRKSDEAPEWPVVLEYIGIGKGRVRHRQVVTPEANVYTTFTLKGTCCQIAHIDR